MFEKRDLTDPFLKTVKAEGGSRRDVFDTGFEGTGALCLRVSARTGKKVWTFVYRNLAAKQGRFRIGSYPRVSLATARKKARELAARVTLGEDPAEDRWKDKLAARGATTFEELARRYMQDHRKATGARKAPASRREDQRIIDKDLLPAWKKRDIETIRRADVIKVLDAIVARGAPVAANRTRALIHTIFEFAAKKELRPAEAANPCHKVENPGEEKHRERCLSKDEIRRLWKALEGFGEPIASLYRLLLLTGQRSGEVKAMRWDEIDWRENLWTIPASKTKNRQEQRVPLSRAALACIEALKKESSSDTWLFPSRFKSTPHVRVLKKTTERLRKACDPELEPFTPHDLRRTFSTGLSEMGIDDVLIAKILNHKWADRNTTSIYNTWKKLPEMRQALERWAGRLEQIATDEPAKVVKMR